MDFDTSKIMSINYDCKSLKLVNFGDLFNAKKTVLQSNKQ